LIDFLVFATYALPFVMALRWMWETPATPKRHVIPNITIIIEEE
jgi:hypothetical protein